MTKNIQDIDILDVKKLYIRGLISIITETHRLTAEFKTQKKQILENSAKTTHRTTLSAFNRIKHINKQAPFFEYSSSSIAYLFSPHEEKEDDSTEYRNFLAAHELENLKSKIKNLNDSLIKLYDFELGRPFRARIAMETITCSLIIALFLFMLLPIYLAAPSAWIAGLTLGFLTMDVYKFPCIAQALTDSELREAFGDLIEKENKDEDVALNATSPTTNAPITSSFDTGQTLFSCAYNYFSSNPSSTEYSSQSQTEKNMQRI